MDARAVAAALVLLPLSLGHIANVHSLHGRPPARLLFAASVVARDEPPRGFTPSPDIYSLSASGQLAQLAFTGGESPVPSPDGRRVAFTRNGELWLMSADGRRQRLLAREAVAAAWSPDSRWIAYTSGTASNVAGIRLIKADGTSGRMLVHGFVYTPRGVKKLDSPVTVC